MIMGEMAMASDQRTLPVYPMSTTKNVTVLTQSRKTKIPR